MFVLRKEFLCIVEDHLVVDVDHLGLLPTERALVLPLQVAPEVESMSTIAVDLFTIAWLDHFELVRDAATLPMLGQLDRPVDLFVTGVTSRGLARATDAAC